MEKILIINGPNLNLLGKRNTDIYGKEKLSEINHKLKNYAEEISMKLMFKQSNHEGEIIDMIQNSGDMDGIILNPGGYTHTSVSIRDAVEAIDIPVIEVHLSNIYAREDFRKNSIIAPVCEGQISGFGWESYKLGIEYLKEK